MEKIFEYLSDPGWWFTAFFVAILSSVVAGLLLKPLESLLSSLSNKYKKRQERRQKRIEILARECSRDGVLLLYKFLYLVFLMLTAFSGLILLLITFIALTLLAEKQSMWSFPTVIIFLILLLSGLLTLLGIVNVPSRLEVFYRGLFLYQQSLSNKTDMMSKDKVD
jgi:MFS family permease